MWPFRQKPKTNLKESHQAILDANKAQEEVTARGPEVRAISRTLRDIRERNHFGESLTIIMERR